MSRVHNMTCKACGGHYQYMSSGYGIDPRVWNDGASRFTCAGCREKVTSFQAKAWSLGSAIEKNIFGMMFVMKRPDLLKLKFDVHRVEPRLIPQGVVSVEPMAPESRVGLFFGKYGRRRRLGTVKGRGE